MTCQNITPVHLNKASLCFNFLYALNLFHYQFSSAFRPFYILIHFILTAKYYRTRSWDVLCSVICCFIINLSDNQKTMSFKHYILKTVCKKKVSDRTQLVVI